MNSSSLKTKNIQAVESYLLKHEETTRVEIATALGLSKMTVTNIINSLIQSGFIEETTADARSSKGRPAKILKRSGNSPKIIVIYVGVTFVKINFMDLSLKSFSEKQIDLAEKDADTLFDEISKELDRLARENLKERIVGIGVGTETAIKDNELHDTKNTLGIDGFNLIERLDKSYQLPITLSPALECSALLESKFGSAKESKEILYIQLGQHIRSVILHEGEIVRFKNSAESEIGHVSIDYNGLSCECGNRGCLEAYASSAAIEKKLRDITKLKLDFRGFCELQGKKNDSRIDWALKDMVDKLSVALIGYANLFHPDTIVIGGEGYYLPDRYLARLEKTLQEKSRGHDEMIRVRKPQYKAQGIELGCALPAIESHLSKK